MIQGSSANRVQSFLKPLADFIGLLHPLSFSVSYITAADRGREGLEIIIMYCYQSQGTSYMLRQLITVLKNLTSRFQSGTFVQIVNQEGEIKVLLFYPLAGRQSWTLHPPWFKCFKMTWNQLLPHRLGRRATIPQQLRMMTENTSRLVAAILNLNIGALLVPVM